MRTNPVRLAFSGLLAAALALACFSAQASAAFPGENGKILWSKVTYDGSSQAGFWRMDPDGTNKAKLNGGYREDLSVSADGSTLAYGDFDGIHTSAVNGSNDQLVKPGNFSDPAFTPDGRIIYVAATTIEIMNADGTASSSLGVVGIEPEMSPDGTQIVFSRPGDAEEGAILIMDSNGDNVETISDNHDSDPSFSPDGSRIAFTSYRGTLGPDSFTRGFTMNADGSDPSLILSDPSEEAEGLRYSPDGTKIVFLSYNNDTFYDDIATVPAGGGAFTVLDAATEDPYTTDNRYPVWQPKVDKIVVNETGDESDAAAAGNTCDTDAATSGLQCTLRAAIETANEGDGDAITFDLDAGSTIAPATPFDDITDTVTIDGTNANRDFTIDGSSAGGAADGLVLLGNDNEVSDLTIEGFDGSGIAFTGNRSTLTDSTIGDPTGAKPNGFGVYLQDTTGTIIGTERGGTPTPAGNLISGNGDPAGLVAVQDAGTATAEDHTTNFGAGIVVEGGGAVEINDNEIGSPDDSGLDASSAAGGAAGYQSGGNSTAIAITGGAGVRIGSNSMIGNNTAIFKQAGGDVNVYGNEISYGWAGLTAIGGAAQLDVGTSGVGGNTLYRNGSAIELLGADGATVKNNTLTENSAFGILAADSAGLQIGGGVTEGNAAIASPFDVALLDSPGSAIDGNSLGAEGFLAPADSDVEQVALLLSSSGGAGVGTSTGNVLGGSLTGAFVANSSDAILEDNEIRSNDWGVYDYRSADTQIGRPGRGNVIGDNTVGVELLTAHAEGGSVAGHVDGFLTSEEGGFAASRLNSIRDIATDLDGLTPDDPAGSSSGAKITENLIGAADEANETALANDDGVIVRRGVTDVDLDDNLIANSTGDGLQIGGGVEASGPQPTGIKAVSTGFDANGLGGSGPTAKGLGIDLVGSDGVTPNDPAIADPATPADADAGPNGLQNFPEITTAKLTDDGTGVKIEGDLESTPSQSLTVEIFGSGRCHTSGYGEGFKPMGTIGVSTDGDGIATFSTTLSLPDDVGWVAATLTGTDGTSEFSKCVKLNVNRIAGEVTYPDGAPVAGVEVKLSGGKAATTKTDGAGTYSFERLPEDVGYTVTAQPTDGRWLSLESDECKNPSAENETECSIETLDSGATADFRTTCGPKFQNLRDGLPLDRSRPSPVTDVQRDEGTSVISFGSLEAYGCFYRQDDGRFISDESTPFRLNGFDYDASQTTFNPSNFSVTRTSEAGAVPGLLSLRGQPIGPIDLAAASYPPGKQQINYTATTRLSFFGIPAQGMKTETETGSTKIEWVPKVPENASFPIGEGKNPQEALAQFDAALNKESVSPSGAVVIKTSNDDGAKLDGVKFELSRDIKVRSGPRLKKLGFEYSESDLQWKLVADTVLPGGLGVELTGFWAYPKVSAAKPIYQRSGYFGGGEIKLKNLNKGPIGSTGAYFQDIGLGLGIGENHTFKSLKGLIGASFLPRLEGGLFVSPSKTWAGGSQSRTPELPGFLDKVGVKQISRMIDLQGEAELTFPETKVADKLTEKSGKIELKGTATLLKDHPYAEVPLAGMGATIQAPYVDPESIGGGLDLLRSKFDFFGQVAYTAPFNAFSVNGRLDGWSTGVPIPYYQLEGNVSASVFGAGGAYRALVGPEVFAICATIGKGADTISTGVSWRDYELAIRAFNPLDSCDFVGLGQPKPFAAPATSKFSANASTLAKTSELKLPKKTDGAGFAFGGKGDPPQLTIKGKGIKVNATKPKKSGSQLIMMDPNTNTTYVFIADPPKGRVKVKAKKGSEIKSVEQAKALPDPAPQATVAPTGDCNTQILSFRQAGTKGQSTDLYEVGPSSRTKIASTSKRQAKLRFQPSAAEGPETREIRATVFQRGAPRGDERTIASYEIGADGTLLGSPHKLKAKRKKNKLIAKWKGGCGAAGYKVVVKKGHKTIKRASTAKTKLKLKVPKKGKLKVSVSSIADDGSVSQAAGAKVKRPRHRGHKS